MRIKVLVIEDDPITSRDLKESLEEHGLWVTGIAKNKTEAIENIQYERPDILLVDIILKGGDSGIDLANEVNRNFSIPFIFLTANSDKQTVQEALKTRPSSFLTKPYDDKDVSIAIELAFNNHCNEVIVKPESNITDFMFLKSGNHFEKVNTRDILYLRADGSYTTFITKNLEYTLSGNLNITSEKVSNPSFIRIHRSYIVNINNITGLDNNYVFVGKENLPISRSYREAVNRKLQRIS